jgi:Flp pilus assembly protein TadG
MRRKRSQHGIAMVEFALVAGLFFLLVTTLLDVGKGVYVKNTLDAAVRDGARAGVILDSPAGGSGQPTLKDIENAIKAHSSDVAFASNPGCPFTTPTFASIPDNTGIIYITSHNMPGGGTGGISTAGCGSVPSAASGHVAITVNVMYKYTPITPLVAQFTGSLEFISTSTMTTEY